MDKMRTRVVNIVNIVNDCTLRNIRGYIRGYNYITNYEHFDYLKIKMIFIPTAFIPEKMIFKTQQGKGF